MAVPKGIALASLLLFASAASVAAFVQPSSSQKSDLLGQTHRVQAQASPEFAALQLEVAEEDSPRFSSLLMGAALGLIISLGGALTANAAYENEVYKSAPSTGRWGQPGPAKFGVDPACELPILTNPKDPRVAQFYDNIKKAYSDEKGYNYVTGKKVQFDIVNLQPESVKACLKKTRAEYEKALAPLEFNKQQQINPSSQGGIRMPAYSLDRLSLGTPGVGQKMFKNLDLSEYEGLARKDTGKLKINPRLIKNFGGVPIKGDDKNLIEMPFGPYADATKPGLGRDDPKVKNYVWQKGIRAAYNDKNGGNEADLYNPNPKFGGSAVLNGLYTK